MIQELFGGSSVGNIIGGERSKLSTPSCGGGGGIILDHSSPSPSPSVSPSSSSAAAAAAAAAAPENLRCPRCDSSNTKFCYYNNYNLTQPRHFCKTCRRYWTKGGALRNVPIGGGCRKNKTTIITAAVNKSSSAAKFKTAPPEMGKTGLFGEALPSNSNSNSNSNPPILWAPSQNSHFLSLIRGNQTLNPNHHHLAMKDEAPLFGSDPSLPNGRALGLDHFGPAHFPSSSLYRNQTLGSQQGILHGEVQNNGLQELYHRLRLSSNYYPEHAPVILGNMASSSTATPILESAPVAAPHEMGFWNSNVSSWPADLSAANGAYP